MQSCCSDAVSLLQASPTIRDRDGETRAQQRAHGMVLLLLLLLLLLQLLLPRHVPTPPLQLHPL